MNLKRMKAEAESNFKIMTHNALLRAENDKNREARDKEYHEAILSIAESLKIIADREDKK